jgi:hypothetical protein
MKLHWCSLLGFRAPGLTRLGIALVLLMKCLGPCNASAVQTPLDKVRVTNLSSQAEPLVFAQDTKAVVFLFLSVECPISNGYAPEFRRLGAEFGPKHVLFELVYPNVDETDQAVRQHLKEYDLPFPALRDAHHDLVKAAEVQTTPEAAVFIPKRGLVYHGRIDNRYAALGVARPEATEHDLHDALAAVVQGKVPPHRSVRPVGCSIGPLPGEGHSVIRP